MELDKQRPVWFSSERDEGPVFHGQRRCGACAGCISARVEKGNPFVAAGGELMADVSLVEFLGAGAEGGTAYGLGCHF